MTDRRYYTLMVVCWAAMAFSGFALIASGIGAVSARDGDDQLDRVEDKVTFMRDQQSATGVMFRICVSDHSPRAPFATDYCKSAVEHLAGGDYLGGPNDQDNLLTLNPIEEYLYWKDVYRVQEKNRQRHLQQLARQNSVP